MCEFWNATSRFSLVNNLGGSTCDSVSFCQHTCTRADVLLSIGVKDKLKYFIFMILMKV